MARKKTTPIARAIDALGGPAKAAAALSIENPSVVFNWLYRGQCSPERVLDIERLSSVPRHELRPDIFGQPERAQ